MKSNNQEWLRRSIDSIHDLVHNWMPRGSGIDNGTTINLEKSHGELLVFNTAYHHMNDAGYYDGWTTHTVRVKPSLAYGFVLTVTGPDRNQIKDYLAELFHSALQVKVPEKKVQ